MRIMYTICELLSLNPYDISHHIQDNITIHLQLPTCVRRVNRRKRGRRGGRNSNGKNVNKHAEPKVGECELNMCNRNAFFDNISKKDNKWW